jgi:hypothetical protein
MKPRFVAVFCFLIVLSFSRVSVAQQPNENTIASADTLRERIEQLEKTELSSRSTTVQDMYKRTLVRLYTEFSEALDAEISDLKKIEQAVEGTRSANNSEVAAQLKQLTTERDVVNEKRKTLNGDTASVASRFSREPRAALPTTAPESVLPRQPAASASIVSEALPRMANSSVAIEAPAAAPPIPFSGKIEVNNDGKVSNARGARVVLSSVAADGKRTAVDETKTQDDGTYTLNAPAPDAKAAIPVQYVITAYVGDFSAERPSSQPKFAVLVRPLGEFSRAIVGLEQSGASSAKSSQRFFMDLTLSAPLPWGKKDQYFGRHFRTWGSIRVTSVPQQINTGVAAFAGAFAEKVGEVKVNELAHGLEFLAGGEYRIPGGFKTEFGSFGANVTTRFTLSFILGGGIITPFTPRDTLEIFKVFRDAPGLPTVPEGKEFIAFVSPDRDRFFRQFYAGLRLQTHYFDYENPDVPLKRYPATLDITYGQNEAVTGGRLRGGVIRLEGFFPLPYEGLKFINLFGTALIKPTRTQITEPLILEAAPTGTTVPANNVFLFTQPQINRDYYKVGVGIDLMSLISKWKAATKKP